MLVEQIWTGNDYRNFNYLIACPETGEALAVDPLAHELCLAVAKDRGWQITQILNTHKHFDHTGGNAPLAAATGAKILAHANARSSIPNMDRGLAAGDVIKVGRTVELVALDTPGHTICHICLLIRTAQLAPFFADTPLIACSAYCHHGGYSDELEHTVIEQLSILDDRPMADWSQENNNIDRSCTPKKASSNVVNGNVVRA